MNAAVGLFAAIQSADELLSKSKLNERIAKSLRAVLSALDELLKNSNFCNRSQASIIDGIEAIVVDISSSLVRYDAYASQSKSSKFRRFCNLMRARTLHSRMMSHMQRLQTLLLTLQCTAINDREELCILPVTSSLIEGKGKVIGLKMDELDKTFQEVDFVFAKDLKTEIKQVGELINLSSDNTSRNGIDKKDSELVQLVRNARDMCDTCDEATMAQKLKENNSVVDRLYQAAVYVNQCEEANISVNELKFETAIASGGYGIVFQAEYNGAKVAVKKVYNANSDTIKVELLSRAADEISLHETLMHPNIVQYLGTAYDRKIDSLYIVMELCMSSLSDYLNKHNNLEPRLVVKLSLGISAGLRYLHSRNVIHSDLKPENILLTPGATHPIPKIGDFGLSIARDSSQTLQSAFAAKGTAAYMAPELLGEVPLLSKKQDVFAFGMILYQLITGTQPFETQTSPLAIAALISKGNRPYFQESTEGENHPDWLISLTKLCWNQDRRERPDAPIIFESLLQKKWPVETVMKMPEPHSGEFQKSIQISPEPQDTVFAFKGKSPEFLEAGGGDGPLPRKRSLWKWHFLIAMLLVTAAVAAILTGATMLILARVDGNSPNVNGNSSNVTGNSSNVGAYEIKLDDFTEVGEGSCRWPSGTCKIDNCNSENKNNENCEKEAFVSSEKVKPSDDCELTDIHLCYQACVEAHGLDCAGFELDDDCECETYRYFSPTGFRTFNTQRAWCFSRKEYDPDIVSICDQ